jgi:hypothetical protein
LIWINTGTLRRSNAAAVSGAATQGDRLFAKFVTMGFLPPALEESASAIRTAGAAEQPSQFRPYP